MHKDHSLSVHGVVDEYGHLDAERRLIRDAVGVIRQAAPHGVRLLRQPPDLRPDNCKKNCYYLLCVSDDVSSGSKAIVGFFRIAEAN